jgi:RIO kinase 2
MEKIDGVELARAELDTEQVVGVLDLVLSEMATAHEAGYVHADMSEYNVFVASEGITIFDWPQAVPTEHGNSRELLTRDVENLLGHFDRKYPHETPNIDQRALAESLVDGTFETARAFEQAA